MKMKIQLVGNVPGFSLLQSPFWKTFWESESASN